ncbi:ROK family protein [Ancylomarina sp. 16SWW S1-10-2]|uniref:ROK family protein n=1 Tax=Ancylomarina sp. 16SWW S1-10-2 TaxID=2499681 RepID=UPI0012AE44EB|nr:ROK family protein [Ancylomarina sp. 16SWW S1-10-2]MRT93862.1 ROK family protein [Ancylomarina sp. 16SWW S1-10-2]
MQKVAVGVDIGGTNTVYGFVTEAGVCLFQSSFSTSNYPIFENFVRELAMHIKSKYKTLDRKYKLVGVGVGAPNASYLTGFIEDAVNLVWGKHLPLVKLLGAHLQLPVELTNDANAAALGEMHYGGAKGMENFMVITLGTGLGCGLVLDGKIYNGNEGYAGEMGHIIVREQGRSCSCGRKGCLETYVSAKGIKRTVSKLLAKYDGPSVLRDIPFNKFSARKLAIAAYNGDKVAIESFEYTGRLLGKTLANVAAIFNPEAIFLSGGLAKAGDLILKPTQFHMESNLLSVLKGKIKLNLSSIKSNAGVLGSAALVFMSGH